MTDRLTQRFRDKYATTPSGCWVWTGACNHRGYGKFTIGKRTISAHRFSYELTNGEIPPGFLILHACDNPPCVNPAHLSLGTQKQNIRDMDARGRRNPTNRKLTDEQFAEILQRYTNGETQVALAAEYGVTQAALSWRITKLGLHRWRRST